jgi:cell division protein FtsW (lipid II flippase)
VGIVALIVIPALALAALGLLVVASAPGHVGPAGAGSARHFTTRQAVAIGLALLAGVATRRLGPRRLLHAAPVLFLVALAANLLVFVPNVGVRAAGASRWLHIGAFTGNPAPLLIAGVGLLIAASRSRPGAMWLTRPEMVAVLALIAVLSLAVEPDFSSAAIALCVGFAALAGGGVAGRRLIPAAALLVIALGLGASRFGYVGNRVHGFLEPERDRRGKGFEVLELAKAKAKAGGTAAGVGIGRGAARRHLSSPASDYAYAVLSEELGLGGAIAIAAVWLSLAGGVVLAVRVAGRDVGARGSALAAGSALVAPAALHVAVCRGWLPIIGVSMPFVSYDPVLTVVSGAEIGLLAAVALAREAPGHRATPGGAT